MQQYIEEFREAITRSQIDSANHDNDQAKIRMTVQDKEKLKMVVEKLYGNNPQSELSPSDRKYPLNYDQSYINVECSDMKTDIINLEREALS